MSDEKVDFLNTDIGAMIQFKHSVTLLRDSDKQ